jgi:hypothetical protein
MMMLSDYQKLYQISPIFLQDGIAAQSNIGNAFPILALLNPGAFGSTLIDGNPDWNMDDAFAIFQPAPGGSLVEQTIAEYPFANLNVAANAILRNPINVSLIMMTPMKTPNSWSLKLSTMIGLKAALDNHNNLGGTYNVYTPAYSYTSMCLTALTDISTAQSPLPQNTWRWDFTRPLVQLEDLQQSFNNLNTSITNGTQVTTNATGAFTGPGLPGSIPPTTFGGPAAPLAPQLFGTLF